MKKLLILFVVCFVIAMLFDVFLRTKSKIDFEKFIKNNTGIEVKDCPIVKNANERNSFNGDGETFVEFDCSKEEIKLNEDKMKPLPFSENISIVMYGKSEDTEDKRIDIGPYVSEEYRIPEIEEGYYYFIDDYGAHYKDLDDVNSDEKLLLEERGAMNFTLLVYDSAKMHLYYYEFDS